MRAMTRLALALLVVLPAQGWAETGAAARPAAHPAAPLKAAVAARLQTPPASQEAPALPLPAAGLIPTALPAPSAQAPIGAAAAHLERSVHAPKAAAKGSFETAASLGREGFDQAAVHEALDATPAPSAPPARPPDDGGGADYPRRDVSFNRKLYPSVAFRPNTDIEALIIQAIASSNKSIRIALYEFTSGEILKALQRAKGRGVEIQVVLDESNAFPQNEPGAEYKRRRSEQIWALVRGGFDLRILRGTTEYGINHNKFAVFDGQMAEFGSYNWSFTAKRSHYENAVFSVEGERVAGLKSYWDYLWALSIPEAQAREHAWNAQVPPPPRDARRPIDFNGTFLPLYVFSPGDELEDAVVSALDAAKASVDYAMFSPRSTKIAEALSRAAKRPGVSVRAVIDEGQSKSEYFKPYADWLALHGVEVKVLAGPNGSNAEYPRAEKMHDKFMILDGKLVQTGSPNHTKRASLDNYENAHFLTDPTDVAGFAFHFSHLWKIAAPLEKPASAEIPTDAQLREDILNPRPRTTPEAALLPKPTIPLPPAETFAFPGHGDHAYPTDAFRSYEPIAEHVLAAINAAKTTIRIAIYQFNHREILAALRRARERGVKIEIVLDRGHVYTTGTDEEGHPRKPHPVLVELIRSGFDLLLLKGQGSGIMHNKFLLVDEQMLQGGSYNYTEQSETDHFENAFFTLEKERIDLYQRYFHYMRGNSENLNEAKLEEILNRTTPAAAEAEAVIEESMAEGAEIESARRQPDEDGRKSKFSPPPADSETPIAHNGRSFPRAIFSPQGGVEDAIVRAIEAAEKTVDVAMFSFFSKRIAETLLAARDARKVRVRLVLDKSQATRASMADWFAWHDFETRIVRGPDETDTHDPRYQKMHNKFMVVDGRIVETGSFNYSPNADRNSFENSNWYDILAKAARFTAVFERMFAQGEKPRKPKQEPVKKDSAAEAESWLSLSLL